MPLPPRHPQGSELPPGCPRQGPGRAGGARGGLGRPRGPPGPSAAVAELVCVVSAEIPVTPQVQLGGTRRHGGAPKPGGAAPGTTLELGVPRPTPAPAVPPGFGAPLGFGVPALTRALLAASCAFRYSVIWGGQSWVTPETLVGFGGSGSTGAWGDPHSPSGAVAGLGSISTGSGGDRDPPRMHPTPSGPTQQHPAVPPPLQKPT